MMFIIGTIFIFIFLILFSFTNNSIYYCGLSVVNAILSSLVCYNLFGFGWYSLLFCLVYIGGVYILFVFVSIFSPNSSFISYYNINFLVLPLLIFILSILGSLPCYNVISVEYSSLICNPSEGYFYLCMCFTLLFGFIILSMLSCLKLNYYR